MSDTQQKRVDTRHQEMDGGQVHSVYLSEGVYGSWRAIGELEGLPSDGDIAQYLVTLYCSSGQQREGGERVLRCGHCRCPLSLSCPACHPPPSPHPHLPPHPSLTSPPPHTPSLSSPLPSAQPPQILHTSDHERGPAADSERVVPNGGGDVKDEESDSTLQGDFDDCSPDLDTVKRESALSRCDSDMGKRESAFNVYGSKLRTITLQHVGAGVETPSGDERRKSQRLARKTVTTLCRGEKKRVAPFGHIEKSVKKKRHGRAEASADSHETSADGTYIKSEEEKTAGIHWQTENAISKESPENLSENNTQHRIEGTTDNVTFAKKRRIDERTADNVTFAKKRGIKRTADNVTFAKKRSQVERKRKPCASQDLEEGFTLPSEQRSSAQIHMYDDSFYDNHIIEDKPPKRPGRPKKNGTKSGILMTTAIQKQGRGELKRTRRRKDSSTTADTNSSSTDEDFQLNAFLDNNALSPGENIKTEDGEIDESDRQRIRILVSAQKILPLRTTTGSYAHNFYSYFECLHCQKAFVHKRAFNSHVQTHVEPKLYTCSLCDKGFKRSCDRIKHERRHNFECSICGKKFTDSNELNEHLKLHTENNGVIRCSGCAFESSDFHEYEKHRSKCTIVQCEVCGVRLKSRFALRFHISAVHENDRPYKCTVCDKSFVLQTNLNSHMKYRHAEGGRAFHCDQCHYRAFDARALSIHQRCLHSNERPFKCTYCPSTFARKFYLVVHLRKHTGEKPHRCTECSQSFAQKPSLTRHRRTRHGLDNAAHNKAAEPQTAACL